MDSATAWGLSSDGEKKRTFTSSEDWELGAVGCGRAGCALGGALLQLRFCARGQAEKSVFCDRCFAHRAPPGGFFGGPPPARGRRPPPPGGGLLEISLPVATSSVGAGEVRGRGMPDAESPPERVPPCRSASRPGERHACDDLPLWLCRHRIRRWPAWPLMALISSAQATDARNQIRRTRRSAVRKRLNAPLPTPPQQHFAWRCIKGVAGGTPSSLARVATTLRFEDDLPEATQVQPGRYPANCRCSGVRAQMRKRHWRTCSCSRLAGSAP